MAAPIMPLLISLVALFWPEIGMAEDHLNPPNPQALPLGNPGKRRQGLPWHQSKQVSRSASCRRFWQCLRRYFPRSSVGRSHGKVSFCCLCSECSASRWPDPHHSYSWKVEPGTTWAALKQTIATMRTIVTIAIVVLILAVLASSRTIVGQLPDEIARLVEPAIGSGQRDVMALQLQQLPEHQDGMNMYFGRLVPAPQQRAAGWQRAGNQAADHTGGANERHLCGLSADDHERPARADPSPHVLSICVDRRDPGWTLHKRDIFYGIDGKYRLGKRPGCQNIMPGHRSALFPISLSNQAFHTENVLPLLPQLFDEYGRIVFLVADQLQIYNRALRLGGEVQLPELIRHFDRSQQYLEQRTRWLERLTDAMSAPIDPAQWEVIGIDELADADCYRIFRNVMLTYRAEVRISGGCE